jgi:alkylation response protein AidB-like acyl-CoA dehydrogenase
MGLRANDSAAVELENCSVPAEQRLTEEGAGFKAKVQIVLPIFNLGCAATSLGICRAAVRATSMHLKNSKLEHLGGISLGEALPILRARLGSMQMETDGLAARIADYVSRLEGSGSDPTLHVLESKAASNQTAINVTANAMLTCGGAAFSGHTGIDRLFRDAQAGQVMAPTVDVTLDLIAKAILGLPLF